MNFHYLFPVAEGLKVYPAAGVVLMGTTGGEEKNYTGVGFNAGAGIEYYVAESIKLNADIKYLGVSKKDHGVKVIDASGITIAIGATYVF